MGFHLFLFIYFKLFILCLSNQGHPRQLTPLNHTLTTNILKCHKNQPNIYNVHPPLQIWFFLPRRALELSMPLVQNVLCTEYAPAPQMNKPSRGQHWNVRCCAVCIEDAITAMLLRAIWSHAGSSSCPFPWLRKYKLVSQLVSCI